jgi:hypothetical protein
MRRQMVHHLPQSSPHMSSRMHFLIPVYFVFTQGGKFVVFSVAAPDEQPREMEYIM